MNARPSLIVGASLVLACLVLGLFFARPTVGQAPAAKPEGAYQAIPVGNFIVVFDPASGQCWTRYVQGNEIKDDPEKAWVSLGTPVKMK